MGYALTLTCSRCPDQRRAVSIGLWGQVRGAEDAFDGHGRFHVRSQKVQGVYSDGHRLPVKVVRHARLRHVNAENSPCYITKSDLQPPPKHWPTSSSSLPARLPLLSLMESALREVYKLATMHARSKNGSVVDPEGHLLHATVEHCVQRFLCEVR